ncbi:uncharacterized protein LOC130506422 [Raphanus sativus]|uniref:Uncharacterized protein LOC130506422 n=1 Tax=Raphanus sativus TaxID=3726 RepID=A0A9W3CZZ7_RAPSA|nr:uncharacterized protein LOC130506422 [Raphanus sativus]
MAAAQQVPQGPQIHVQQGPQIHMQQVPPVQVQHDHQVPAQQAPAPQYPQVPIQPVPGVFQVPPPPPAFPMKYVKLGAFQWYHRPYTCSRLEAQLDKCLNTISCPPRHKLGLLSCICAEMQQCGGMECE